MCGLRPSAIALAVWPVCRGMTMKRWMSSLLCVALLLVSSQTRAATRAIPLLEAARAGNVRALRLLVQQKVNVNASEADGSTALHWAAHRGDLVMAEALIGAGARVNAANQYGVTPLSLAAESGSAAVVGRLLKAGANVKATLAGGETALMTAARAGRLEVVKVLTENGAEVNAREETRGQTALMWAAAEGHADVIQALVRAGADLKVVSRGPQADKSITDGESIYKRIAPRVDAFTALQFAVQAGHIDAVKALLDAGANILDETPQGMGTLTMAIANKHFELAALLVERGADVNQRQIGFAPLHQLVRVRTLNIGQFPHPVATGTMSGLDLARLLIRKGAIVDIRNTKFFADGFRGFFGPDATPFLLACKGGDADMVKLLLAAGADPKAVNSTGTNALMAAAGVDMFNPNEDSGTNAEGLAVLKIIVGLGYDPNAMNKSGEAALHGAVHRGSNEIIKLLVDNGADVGLKNKKGFTPLQVANGEDLFIGMVGKRPDAIALLTDLMIKKGLKPEMKEDTSEFYEFTKKAK